MSFLYQHPPPAGTEPTRCGTELIRLLADESVEWGARPSTVRASLVSHRVLGLAACYAWFLVGTLSAAETGMPITDSEDKAPSAVKVYYRMTFDGDVGGWNTDAGVKSSLVSDAAHGQALRVDCERGWAGCELPIDLAGSRGLKLALMMKSRKIESVGINAYDSIARDNTTAYGYRYLKEDGWTPILYRLDEFRYNSRAEGTVSPNTHYTSVRFYAPERNVAAKSLISARLSDLIMRPRRPALPSVMPQPS